MLQQLRETYATDTRAIFNRSTLDSVSRQIDRMREHGVRALESILD
jgi:hypothetical protein